MPQNLKSYSTNATIGCPFFKRQEGMRIICEGMFEGQYNTILFFKNAAAKNEHINDFCNGTQFFRGCPIAIAIQEKYELQGD